MITLLRCAIAASLLSSVATPAAAAQIGDVVFVATPAELVIGMLDLAGVSDRDVVYDLGSGDGRIVIAAARHYGARGVGVEIDSNLVEESRRSADSAGVAHRVEFRRGDLFATDLRDATVVTLFLGRMLNDRLRPVLFRDLRPGSRVVSQNFDMGDWEPDSVILVRGRHVGETPVHLWVMPADVAGEWRVEVQSGNGAAESFALPVEQRYQMLGGPADARGRVRGERFTLQVTRDGRQLRFDGRVQADSAWGTVRADRGAPRPWKATRPPRPRAGRP